MQEGISNLTQVKTKAEQSKLSPESTLFYNNLDFNIKSIKAAIVALSKDNLPHNKLLEYAEMIFNYSKESFLASEEILNINKQKINEEQDSFSFKGEEIFIWGLIHDLKNNFGGIVSFCGMIVQEEDSSKIIKYIDIIKNTCEESLFLISKIQKIEKNSETVDMVKTNLNDEIKKTIGPLAYKAEEKNIEIENQVNIGIEIETDPYMLKSILKNLILNAIKFSYLNGKITIKMEKNDNFVNMFVIDQGIGLSKERLDDFFENLGTSTAGTTGEIGTGYGMFTSYENIKKIGGDLQVQSEGIGKGTTFILTLPIEEKSKE